VSRKTHSYLALWGALSAVKRGKGELVAVQPKYMGIQGQVCPGPEKPEGHPEKPLL